MINKLLVAVIIIVAIGFIGFLISNLEVADIQEEENFDEYVLLAEEWIYENSLTFNERGGLDLEHIRTVEIEDGVYEITFNFNSSFAGYGAIKEDEMTAQVITPHVVVVVVEGETIKSVVIDDIFDETSNEENEMVEVDVYFVVVRDNNEELIAVKRLLSINEEVEKNALLQLLLGLTEEEKSLGYSTTINNNVEINDFYIEEKVAQVDFTEELNVPGGSALVMMIRDQIEKTLLQFDTIERVEISIEGETEDILQP